jgi:uncharacterized protein YjiS (DUF1127 family)
MLSKKIIFSKFSSSNLNNNTAGDALSSKVILDNLRIIKISEVMGRFAKNFIASINRFVNQKNMRRELNTMPDYLLLDIGVQRDQINGIVSGRIGRKPVEQISAINRSSSVLCKDQDDTPLAA